jgi:hypothetical protein
MAIAIATDPASGRPMVTFTLPADAERVVSVVGSFNRWTPGVDTFEASDEATVAVTVAVEPGHDVHFRYLGSDGGWFDDLDADEITEHGSVLRAARFPAQPAPPASTVPAPAEMSPSPQPTKRRRGTKQRA